jgi:membrane protein required for colicin V production
MLGILAGAILWGAWKGMAWQVASVASLVLSYVVALKFSEPLAASGIFGESAPWRRFAAMLALYIVTSAVVWVVFQRISSTLEYLKLGDFDRQLGGVCGAIKGVLLCVAITFFVVTVLPENRAEVLNTHSGRAIGRFLAQADAIMPVELKAELEPYLKPLEEQLQVPHAPNRWNDDRRDLMPWSTPQQSPRNGSTSSW